MFLALATDPPSSDVAYGSVLLAIDSAGAWRVSYNAPAGAIVVRQTGATAGQFTFVIFPCQTIQHLLLYYFFQYHQCGDGLAQRHGARHGLHISRDLQGASDHHPPVLDNNGIYYRVSDYLGSLARCSTVYFVQKHWLLQTKHSHHYG